MKNNLMRIAVIFATTFFFCVQGCTPQEPEVILAKSVKLSENKIEIIEGEQIPIKITILPENTSDKSIVWNSSDEEVAIVNDGVVKA